MQTSAHPWITRLKRWASLILAVIAAWVTTSAAGETGTPAPKPAPEKFHLYLLMGQSNMMGRGLLEEADKRRAPNPRILVLDRDGTWQIARDPLHFDNPRAGVGPGIAFAEAMLAANPDITIGLVPCAKGGSSLASWSKDAIFHNAALERARIAARSGVLKGILWHQGESDGRQPGTANTFADRLPAMVADVRRSLGSDLPFVAGNLGSFIHGHPSFPYTEQIDQALSRLGAIIPGYACVRADGLTHIGDKVHFDAASQREFGRRYAEAMRQLSASQTGEKPLAHKPIPASP